MPNEPWYQAALFESEVLQLDIRIGVINSVDHVQALVELQDPTNGRLIAQWSAPHTRMEDLRSLFVEACAQARIMLQDQLEEF